jgi:predicted AAA+ superfamily ATPase
LYGKKPTYLFFDEIQNLKNYGKILRTFKDSGYKIVVSGSSSQLLLEEVSTELR